LADPPRLYPGPVLSVAIAVSRAIGSGGATELNTPVAATHVIQSEPCLGVKTTVAWYDWTLEVGQDQPYNDLSKTLEVDLDASKSRAFLMDGGDPGPIDLDGAGAPLGGFPKVDVSASADGGAALTLGRTPLVVVTLADGWPAEGPDAVSEQVAETPIPDSSENDVSPGGGGGCATGSSAGGPCPIAALLFLVGVIVSRRRVAS
ncbi:MAG: hypothetical protein GXP54_08325, partial [Deltaproteobacteria bacterium]|nr:hypothetical protein [Deltaproteobacteria bacterium]